MLVTGPRQKICRSHSIGYAGLFGLPWLLKVSPALSQKIFHSTLTLLLFQIQALQTCFLLESKSILSILACIYMSACNGSTLLGWEGHPIMSFYRFDPPVYLEILTWYALASNPKTSHLPVNAFLKDLSSLCECFLLASDLFRIWK